MNVIGKFLTIAILVMSIIFLSTAFMVYSKHTNWEQKAKQAQADLANTRQEVERYRNEVQQKQTQLAAERAARTSALAAVETRARQYEQESVQSRQVLDRLQEESRVAVTSLAAAQQTMENLKNEVDGLRSAVKSAHSERDRMFQEVVDWKNKVTSAESVVRRLEQQNDDLTTSLSRTKAVLRTRGLNEDTPLTNVAPLVKGRVLRIGEEGKLIEVSIGGDDGLQRNNTLEVYRGDNYLGRLRVTQTSSDRAVGMVLDGFRNGAIGVGDSVATQIR